MRSLVNMCSRAMVGLLPLWGTLLLSAAQDAPDEVILDEIVARVNEDVVTKTDLEGELRRLQVDIRSEIEDDDEFRKLYEQEKRKILENLIETRLMAQKAEEIGLPSVDEDVDRFLQNLMDQNGIPNLQVLDQALQQTGRTLQEFRRVLQERMTVGQVKNSLVFSRITLLTPEINAYYEEHKEQFSEPPQVTLAEIAVLYEDKTREEAEARAREVLSKLDEGASFEKLAEEYSEGATAARGGGIGTFRKGALAEPLEKVAFSLKVGEHSRLIENDWGIQIVKVTARDDSRIKALEEVRPEIEQALYEKKAAPQLESFIAQLIENSYIFVSPKYRDQFDLREGI